MSGAGSDAFATATAIAAGDTSDSTPTNGLTVETGEPASWYGADFATAWWRFDPTADGWYQADTELSSTSNDTVLEIYAGYTVDTLVQVGRDDDNGAGSFSKAHFYAYAGIPYYLRVSRYSASSSHSYRLRLNSIARPPNPTWGWGLHGQAMIPSPTTVTLGAPGASSSSGPTVTTDSRMNGSTHATATYTNGSEGAEIAGVTRRGWYKIIAPCTGLMKITFGGTGRTIHVYDSSLSIIAGDNRVMLYVPVTLGATYYAQFGYTTSPPSTFSQGTFSFLEAAKTTITAFASQNSSSPYTAGSGSGSNVVSIDGSFITMAGIDTSDGTPYGSTWNFPLPATSIDDRFVLDVQTVQHVRTVSGSPQLGVGMTFTNVFSGTSLNFGPFVMNPTSFRTHVYSLRNASDQLVFSVPYLEAGNYTADPPYLELGAAEFLGHNTTMDVDYFAVDVWQYEPIPPDPPDVAPPGVYSITGDNGPERRTFW